MTALHLRHILAVPFLLTMFFISSCDKNSKSAEAHLQVRLVDNPTPDAKEVWVDIQQVEVIVNDGAPVLLGGIHPGLYNLLELTNGRDTLLADALIPAGKVSQLRLILGDNNFITTRSGEKIPLKTPSAQQSGLKVQIHQDLAGGILYRLTLDFDVARSIVQAGNSGIFILKPVLRVMSFIPSGGDIRGVVAPGNVLTAVLAINGNDTVATTFTAVPAGNYFIKDIPAGNYLLSFIPADLSYKPIQKNISVALGQVALPDTIQLQH
ncbi:MAG: DUF4382 domain-containing protein [Chitinophagaceae bacterium]